MVFDMSTTWSNDYQVLIVALNTVLTLLGEEAEALPSIANTLWRV